MGRGGDLHREAPSGRVRLPPRAATPEAWSQILNRTSAGDTQDLCPGQRGAGLCLWGPVPIRTTGSPADAHTEKGQLGPRWTRTSQVEWGLHALELLPPKARVPAAHLPKAAPVPTLGPGSWVTLNFVLASSLPTSQLPKFHASPQRFSLAWTSA